ncbi:MAG: NAD-dependent epimerase/dehydratase family protein, partial [Myxococcales bacterium]
MLNLHQFTEGREERHAESLPFTGCGRSRQQVISIPMNVLVTGGAGYIGSVCTEELLNAGHSV